MSTTFPWYAVRVKLNHERTVVDLLGGQGYESYLPLTEVRRRWTDRYKCLSAPLFPGYLFCRLDVGKRLPILTTPGVVDLVRFGKQFVPVEEQQLAQIRRIVDSQLPIESLPYLKVGKRVVVEYGPLAGLEGILTQVKGTNRLVVNIEMLQRSVSVELNADWVRPVTEAG
jgi:transcription antitermination factor NusG